MSGSIRQAGDEVATVAGDAARATADWASQVNEEVSAVASQVTRASRDLTDEIAREAAISALLALPAMASMPAVSRGSLRGLIGGVRHIEAEFRSRRQHATRG